MSVVDGLADLVVPIDSLTPLPDNPRKGDVEAVAASLARFGQRKPIVVRSSDRTITAGNHTWLAAKQLGWSEIAAVVLDDDDATAGAYALADNRTAELGGYDERALLDLIRQVGDSDPALLADTGWDEASIAELVDQLGAEGNPFDHDPGSGDDEAEDPPEEPVTQLGDVWLLGQHRLVCGDSSDPAVLDTVIRGEKIGCLLTDPPYGMNLDADYSKMPGGNTKSQMNRQPKKYRDVIGDDKPFDASLLREYFSRVKEQFWFGADYYRRTLSGDDIDGSWLIWDKRTEEQDDVIGSGFETCWSAQKHQRRLLRHYWCGAFGNAEARNRVHPTQKPTALLVDILERWAPEGLPVADAFGGSGSTLVAAHMTGRPARLVELDPRYCDVIARRYQDLTGDLPALERTGERFDFHGADGPVAVAA